jgi:peroxiredoxin family protein
MTPQNREAAEACMMKRLAIICSKGTLDMAYPGLVLALAARNNGIEVVMFYTFWGMDVIHAKKVDNLKISPLCTNMPMPSMVSILPGVGSAVTAMMKRKIESLDIPTIRDLVELVAEMGAEIYGCKMTIDMMGIGREELLPQVKDVVGANEFFYLSKGAQIIFI